MSLFDDVGKIVLDQPEVKKLIEKAANDLFKVINKSGWFTKEPSRIEQLQHVRGLVDILATEDLQADKFKGIVDYLGFILAAIGLTVELQERGVVLSSFYANNRVLYFPRPAGKLKLIRFKTSRGDDSCGLIVVDQPIENREYDFYSVNSQASDVRPSELQNVLDQVCRAQRTKDEHKAFLDRLGDNYKMATYLGIMEDNSVGTFWLIPKNPRDSQTHVQLSWENSKQVRQAIAKDLTRVLDFKLIS
jgi:hypothetical protein